MQLTYNTWKELLELMTPDQMISFTRYFGGGYPKAQYVETESHVRMLVENAKVVANETRLEYIKDNINLCGYAKQ